MLHLTTENFEMEIKRGSRPTVVMFYAIWCGKCAMMKPVAEDVAEKNKGRIRFCEVEIDESPALAAKYGADIVPTFVFFKNGKVIKTMKGILSQSVFEQRLQEIFRNC